MPEVGKVGSIFLRIKKKKSHKEEFHGLLYGIRMQNLKNDGLQPFKVDTGKIRFISDEIQKKNCDLRIFLLLYIYCFTAFIIYFNAD